MDLGAKRQRTEERNEDHRLKRQRTTEEKELEINLPYIPEDILLFNVLPRLSFKSLCRFKAVCKNWSDLISTDPLFAVRQSEHISPTSSGFVLTGYNRLLFLPTYGTPIGVLNPYYRSSTIVASANGLLCLSYCRDFLYVCNPVTRESQAIPRSKNCYSVGLAFDPSISPARYKLVHPIRSRTISGEIEYRFDVFSSETGKGSSRARRSLPNCYGATGRPCLPAGSCIGIASNTCCALTQRRIKRGK